MESLLDRKNELINDITKMRKGSYEQMYLITMYGLDSYFKSLLTFGYRSDVTRDNLNVIKEMFKILKTERSMLNFILRNLDGFDITSTEDVVWMLDELNDRTIEYYYSVIDEIEDAVDMGEERRGSRPRKNFATLIQTDSYTNEVKALALNKQAIREFLGYEDEFWSYIEEMDKGGIRVPYEGAQSLSYAVPIYDDDKNVSGLKMYVTEISDLRSALLAIQTYEKAYGIYRCIGKNYVPIDFTFERQEEFEKSYLPNKRFEQLKKVPR